MTFTQRKSPEARFWEWFEQNEVSLFSFETDQGVIFSKLASELHRIDSHLTFEFGPNENGKRDFVISAGGIKSAFASVVKLADAAPQLARWNIIKFRPRREPLNTVQIGNISVDPDDVLFTMQPDGDKVDITLYLADQKSFDKKLHAQISFLLLDQAIGEYDVETFVGHIEFRPKEMNSRLSKRQLTKLASEFDKLLKTISH